ncbi:MAG: tRNA pseudouridine(55) synthase TruB [Alphaproteobacteria bacterium]|nr:tRNA pseudouridine(55) synthase TruB [Alphaproteobacteria bacterium]MBO6863686.1 tRNA pseudouridine(55) synthase TruB [Alphaproteobacteria bacterium]
MAKRKKGDPIHGWVVLDKPEGMGSTDAVSAVRRTLNAQKAGHGGTLDPFATGLLPIALGEATKTVQYVMDGAKSYRFTLRFGVETDTLDPEGEAIETSEIRPDDAAIQAAIPGFLGEIDQIPPAYSAIKMDGKRAYDRVRAGETVEMQPRRVRIDALRLIGRPDADHAVFDVDCGKGTYIRSLGRDLAKVLGTVGSLTALRRTKVGPFAENQAISLDALAQIGHKPGQSRGLLAIEAALDGIPAMVLSEVETVRLRNGQPVPLLRKVDLARIADLKDGDEVVAFCGEEAVALARYGKGEIRPVRVLNR